MIIRKRLSILLPILAAVLAIAASAVALWPAGPPSITTLTDVGNFKAVYLVDNPEATRVTAHIIIQSGEADSTGPEGLAHYTEHLTWLNTVGKMAPDGNRDTNAWTTSLATGYWLSGETAKFPELMATLQQIFKPINAEAQFAEEERKIILREYDLSLAENARGRAYQQLDPLLYAGNGRARSVMGKPGDIQAFKPAEAMRLHDLSHRQVNAVLVVVGNIKPADIRKAVTTLPGQVGSRDRSDLPELQLADNSAHTVAVEDPNAPVELIWRKTITLESPVQFDLLRAQTNLLSEILEANLDGGLAGPLRFDAFIASSFTVSLSVIDERHIELFFNARPDTGVTLKQLQTTFEQAFARTAAKGISTETFDRVKARFEESQQKPQLVQAQADELSSYVIARVSSRRAPLEADIIWDLYKQPDRASINALLSQLAGDGRIAIANIGKAGQ